MIKVRNFDKKNPKNKIDVAKKRNKQMKRIVRNNKSKHVEKK